MSRLDPLPRRFISGPSGLTVQLVDGQDEATRTVMARFKSLASTHRHPRVGLATGRTFEGFFAAVAAGLGAGALDLSHYRLTHLDEFLETGPADPGGMAHQILAVTNASETRRAPQFVAVDALQGPDPAAGFCRQLKEFGSIHLQLLGIGRNGHVAFNEPGVPFSQNAHVVELDARTLQDNALRFGDGRCPTRALTQGPADILAAEELMLVALGEHKADAVVAMLEGPISVACPASMVRLHANATVILDHAAASRLGPVSLFQPERLPGPRGGPSELPESRPVVLATALLEQASASCAGLLADLPPGTRKSLLHLRPAAAARETRPGEAARQLGADLESIPCRSLEVGAYVEEDAERLLRHLHALAPGVVLVPDRAHGDPRQALTRRLADEALRRYVVETGRELEVWTFEAPPEETCVRERWAPAPESTDHATS